MPDLPGRDRSGVPAWRVDRIAGHAELVVDEAPDLEADLAPGFVEMGSEDGVRVAGEAVAGLRSFKQTMR